MFPRHWSTLKKLIWLRAAVGSGGGGGTITTVTGASPLSLVNALAHEIKSLTQYGKLSVSGAEVTCNNGTLTVVDGQIVADGTPEEIVVQGKNLWSVGNQTFVQFLELEIEPIPAGSYIFSGVITSDDTDANQCAIILLDETLTTLVAKSIGRSVGGARVSTSSFTISSPAKYVRLYASNGFPSGVGDTANYVDCQLEAGDTATDFVPYHHETATAENLFAVDDIVDEQDIITGKVIRRTEAVVSDGTTPSGRYVGEVGVGNIIVKARETGYTGEVVSFTTEEETPLNGLRVNFEPIQDLHGYDAPWPAGGGVNILEDNYENGTLTIPYGTPSPNADYKRSKNFVKVSPSTQYYLKADSAIFIKYFDENQNAVTSIWDVQSRNNVVITTGSTTEYIKVVFPASMAVTNFGINYPSSVTTYSPYSNICPITGYTGVEAWDDPKYGGGIWWNQLAKIPMNDISNSMYGVTYTDHRDGSYTLDGKATQGFNVTLATIGLIENHYYYIHSNPIVAITNDMGYAISLGSRIQKATGTRGVSFSIYTGAGKEYDNTKVSPFVCDLTQMFGAGNEPSTVEEFEALFPHDYYEYNSGTQTTVGAVNGEEGNHLAVTFGALGKNLFDKSKFQNLSTDYEYTEQGYRCKAIQLTPNTVYTVSQSSGIAESTPILLINNKAAVNDTGYFDCRLASHTRTYTTDETGCLYIGTLGSDSATNARIDVCNIQIELGSTATAYEPYNDTVYGGYYDFVNGKLVGDRAYGDAGKLNWALSGTNVSGEYRFSCAVPTVIAQTGSAIPNIRCSQYKAVSPNDTYSQRIGISNNLNLGQLIIFDPAYKTSSAADFKTAMSGVDIVYELATPIVYQLSPQAIGTLRGLNNVWSNGKSVNVYVSDGELIVQVTPQKLKTSAGDNVVSVSSNVDPVTLSVEYAASA